MTIKIDKKITGYEVSKPEDKQKEATQAIKETAEIIHMHEKLERPEMLLGSTYKIKTPLSEHALYITINDVVLNPDTEHELRRPYEIFINSKNMDHFQWIVALTRIISAVFRKGGDVTFLVDELRSVFDPRGGYFKKGGKYMPSLVAEIGDAIEHEGQIWLVPVWLESKTEAWSAPLRLICISAPPAGLQLQKIEHEKADYNLNYPIPLADFLNEAPPETDHEFMVIERPALKIGHPH